MKRTICRTLRVAFAYREFDAPIYVFVCSIRESGTRFWRAVQQAYRSRAVERIFKFGIQDKIDGGASAGHGGHTFNASGLVLL